MGGPRSYFFIASTCFLYLGMVVGQAEPFEPNDEDLNCFKFDSSCKECISDPGCQWCSDFKDKNEYHCFSKSRNLTNKCDVNDTYNPVNSFRVPPNGNLPLSKVTKDKTRKEKTEKFTQMHPQIFNVKLRKNEPMSLKITYRQVDDYPLDLYYLMDLSKSMKPHKRTLSKLGKKLADTLRKLTSRFRLGFGSFVDKVLLPYVNTLPQVLKNPCFDGSCQTPFSFINNLPLTENASEFEKKVSDAKISSNLDSPEGGFDGLMQAMVCKDQIGWSKQVRKIIVFSTDAQFHMAGDGKLAGVIKPNDAKCRLNKNGVYDKFDEYDYPSVGQISEVAQKEGINIIFAEKNNAKLYKELSSYIEGSSHAQLSESSGNIVQLVANVYNDITGRVEIQQSSDTLDKDISVKVESDCKGDGRSFKPTHYCEGIKEGHDISFKITVELLECPKSMTHRKKSIKVGTLQETVEIQIEMLCDCDCEIGYERTVGKSRCNNKGSVQCGVCICDKGAFGKECQCSRSDVNKPSVKSDINKCKLGNDTKICSGHGSCECETCLCKKDYLGKFCECNRALCRRQHDSEVLCSGNGDCKCDKCNCKSGWVGDHCQCQDFNACIQPGTNKICSGHGVCECGLCSCSQDKIQYSGEFCEECPSCENGQCDKFRDCVQCKHFANRELNSEVCKNCTINTHLAKSLDGAQNSYASLCTYTDNVTNCDMSFTYKFISKNNYEITVKEEQDCPEPINFFAVTVGVTGGVVAIGILTLLIWKLITTIHDRREYESFIKESQAAKFSNENATYVPATTLVANPQYKS